MVDTKRFAIPKNLKKRDELPIIKTSDYLNEVVEELPKEDIPVFRANIGARNPFVIAKRKMGSPDSGLKPRRFSPSIQRSMVKKAFKKVINYEEMFDPKSGSPLYQGLLKATERLKDSNARLYETMYSQLEAAPKIMVGGPPPECKNLQNTGILSNQVNGVQLQYRNLDAGAKNAGMEFTDPVQGCLPNCWFFAALSSVAWAESNLWTPKLARNTNLYFFPKVITVNPITKKETVTRPKKPIISSADFYLDDLNLPYYGHTNPKHLVAQYYEMWPSYYEKCCASFWEQGRTPPFVQKNAPLYEKLNYGDPFEALSDITGLFYTNNTTAYTRIYFGPNDGADNDAGMINKIRIGSCDGITFDADPQFIPATRPTVAYTYCGAEDVDALANRQQYGNPVVYDCPGIPANHAFSILGVYQGTGQKYVVLRNPWGCAGDTGSFSQDLQGYLATDLKNQSAFQNLNITNEGIFGLQSTCFMRYFDAFGWV